MTSHTTPSRDHIIQSISDNMYSGRVLNNSHRGDVVEMMVLSALQPEWKFVGLGWHPWDLQRGTHDDRVRIQVKQSAALQLWGPTKRPAISFGWSKKAPGYFVRDNPGERIESEGWFCEIFVVGIHSGTDPQTVDQVDPEQWRFLVIPATDLKKGTNSMVLTKAIDKWNPVGWQDISETVSSVFPT